MEINKVKKALRDCQPTVGSWIQIGHPAVAEIMCNSGFDWIAVDMEHTDISLETMTNVFRGMYGRNVMPFVRVRENDPLAIRQVLDAGAMGVIVPLVNNADEAKRAVAAAKYPPAGIRGFAFCRANEYGRNFSQYVKEANEQIAVVVMIESKEAVENIDEIIAVDGVDGVFVGPYDLSGSYGVPGDLGASFMQGAMNMITRSCKKHNKSFGIHLVNPDANNVKKTIESGGNFIALGMDTVFLEDNKSVEFIEMCRKLG
jgi:2-keto-3-deoxy-L-rhamnonate aldolase RhmA